MIISIYFSNWFFIYNYELIFDSTSVLLTILILIIYNIVNYYSNWYLEEDPSINRFKIFLNLFVLTMLILVLSNNIIILFVGWELVGLISYYLISFWNTKIFNLRSGIKAILYNKIGDIGLLLVILNYYNLNNIFLLGFIIGAIAKSAQIFFIGWLTSAMSGPTPVSSLLHSATMVTAGIYLLIRYNIYSEYYSYIGIITLLLGGLLAIISNDIKTIIALSTVSQLGYLFYSQLIGLSNYNHIIIHGFFKSLLFLTSGLIIHKLINIQDIRQYGSLIFILPIEYLYFLISSLSLIAIPYFSGYYTKELLILNTFNHYFIIFIFSIIGSWFTFYYSIRLFYYTFLFKPNKAYSLHNISIKYYLILIILLLGGLILGKLLISDYYDYENLSILYKYAPLYIFFLFSFNFYKIYYIDNIFNFIIKFINLSLYSTYKFIQKGLFDLNYK